MLRSKLLIAIQVIKRVFRHFTSIIVPFDDGLLSSCLLWSFVTFVISYVGHILPWSSFTLIMVYVCLFEVGHCLRCSCVALVVFYFGHD